MAGFTAFAQNRIVDWLMRGQAAPALAANWHVALFTAVGNDAGAGFTEVAGGGYARAPVARSLAAFSGTQGAGSVTASSGANLAGADSTNNADLTFLQPTADWGQVVGFGLYDAAAGGNLWLFDTLAAPKTVQAGDSPPRFPAGTLGLTLD